LYNKSEEELEKEFKTITVLKAVYDELKIYEPNINPFPTFPSEVE
jgi:hypothetical protein